MLNLGGNLGII